MEKSIQVCSNIIVLFHSLVCVLINRLNNKIVEVFEEADEVV